MIKEQKLNPSKWTFFCSKEKLTENPIYGNPGYLPYGKRGKGGYGLVGESDGIHQEPFDQIMSTNYVSFQNFSNSDQNKILTEVEKKSVKEIAETAKKVCEDFGYKPGTEKFADCAKEIYLKEIEQTETSTVVVQQDNSGAEALANELKRQRKQQVFDELMGISEGLLGGKSIPEVLGAPSNSSRSRSISCNNTGETISGTNKICYYSCTGSSVTTNVGAAQQCPLTINR